MYFYFYFRIKSNYRILLNGIYVIYIYNIFWVIYLNNFGFDIWFKELDIYVFLFFILGLIVIIEYY